MACLPLDENGVFWVNGDLGCWKRDDGAVYRGSGMVGGKLGPGWGGCDLDAIPDAPACA